jgi:type II restriction enzyme
MKEDPRLFKFLDIKTSDEYFNLLVRSFKESITSWDYFVNWAKVFKNVNSIEIELNLLNYLIGKSDDVIEEEFEKLLQDYPKLVKVIPILVALRENKINVLVEYNEKELVYKNYQFNNNDNIKGIVEFTKNSGLLELFSQKKLKNLVDYVTGIEVGLDSNGRKNRTGTLMEKIIDFYVALICKKNNLDYIPQATSDKVLSKWNKNLTVDKSSRIIDFAINNGKNIYLVETNFYGGGGSKLKATAGEYITMFNYWKDDGHNFIWITDGFGWTKTLKPLREAHNKIDYILNLQFILNGVLEFIICNDI